MWPFRMLPPSAGRVAGVLARKSTPRLRLSIVSGDIDAYKETGTLRIDRSGLLGYARNAPQPPSEPRAVASVPELTPLLHTLRGMLRSRGPISLAEYMRLALCHPTLGYYMKRDIFGARGDFVTSPEVSQMFGELIAVWMFMTWRDCLSAPPRVRLVELGPGRGTLLCDVLRVCRRSFPALAAAIQAIDLVEVSPALRLLQARALRCTGVPPKTAAGGVRSVTATTITNAVSGPGGATTVVSDEAQLAGDDVGVADAVDFSCDQTVGPDGPLPGLRVTWHNRFEDIPSAAVATAPADPPQGGPLAAPPPSPPLLVLAHELFDALPVHQFVAVESATTPNRRQWRERLVDVAESGTSGGGGLQLVLASGATPASAAYAALLDERVADAAARTGGTALPLGSIVELCPAAEILAASIADRIGAVGGAALIIDYGHGASDASSATGKPSLRGIRGHAFTLSPLDAPGEVDLSIDVDFEALRRAALRQQRVSVYGPVTQSYFLQSLGLEARATALLRAAAAGADASTLARLVSDAERLANPAQMGSIYKAMALVSARGVAHADRHPTSNEAMVGSAPPPPGFA